MPTRPLTVPVPAARVDDAPVVDDAPTEVIEAPGPWVETAEDVRTWWSSARARLARHRAFATRRQTATTLILAAMVCAAIVMLVVAALSPDHGSGRSPRPSGNAPGVHSSFGPLHTGHGSGL